MSRDPIILLMVQLEIPVTRANYLNFVAPGGDPDDLDAEVEAEMPEELRLQGDEDE